MLVTGPAQVSEPGFLWARLGQQRHVRPLENPKRQPGAESEAGWSGDDVKTRTDDRDFASAGRF